MADAPASSGNKLAGVEILLLVILGIGALAVLSGNPLTPVKPTAPTTTSSSKVVHQCGFIVSHVNVIQGVQQNVVIDGIVSSCNPQISIFNTTVWASTEPQPTPGGTSTPIVLTALNNTTGHFSVAVPVVAAPGTTLYVTLFTTGSTAGDNVSLNVRVPVTIQ